MSPRHALRPGASPVAGLQLAVGAGVLATTLLAACSDPAPGSVLEEPQVDRTLQPYGIDVAPAELPSTPLGWQVPPEDCPHAYRISTSYEPALRFEEDSASSLVVGRHPRQQPERPIEAGPIPPGAMVPAQIFYQGIRVERIGATRDVYFTGELVGPAAPTAACMPRTWDPMEDALALGWPRLPGRLTAVGEAWNGLPVEGKCNRSACVDPQTGGGGPDTHALTCVTPPWHETFAGLYEHQGELYAWIHSRWSDGHGPEQGINTERKTLVSVEHGRPVWSQTRVDHRFAQPVASGGQAPVVRTWTLESIDACPGSLTAAGWARPPELAVEDARLQDRLANADEVRRNPVRAPRRPPQPAAEPKLAPAPGPALEPAPAPAPSPE